MGGPGGIPIGWLFGPRPISGIILRGGCCCCIMFGPGIGIGGNAPEGGGIPGGPRIGLGGIPCIPGGPIIGGNGGLLGGPLGVFVLGFGGVGVPCVRALYLGSRARCSS